MILSAQDTDRVKHALKHNNWAGLEDIITDAARYKGKHARIQIQCTVNSIIVTCALQNDNPELLSALLPTPREGVEEITSSILKKYITTKDIRWRNALTGYIQKLEKKSLQSHIRAFIAEQLISTGISESDPASIYEGLNVLNTISFRKYRSDSIIKSIPAITGWCVIHDDISLLHHIQTLLTDVNDTSRCAVLQAEIAQAFATIAIHKKDMVLYQDSIRFAVTIHQKLRRKICLSNILNNGIKSSFGKTLIEIYPFILDFKSQTAEMQSELISAITEQLLDQIKNKDLLIENFNILCRKNPIAAFPVIYNLLVKAERSGDPWYLSNAVNYLQYTSSLHESVPIKDIVHAGIVVARTTHSTQVLVNLIPIIEKIGEPREIPQVYLQFSQVMLQLGDFDNTKRVFSKIPPTIEELSQYGNCLAKLIETGVYHDQKTEQFREIFAKSSSSISCDATRTAVHQICHGAPFADIVKHYASFKQLLMISPGNDSVILESIKLLIERGFLDSWDSSILVDLAKSIQDISLREQAISMVVIKLAEIGVRTGNRDFLQRSVGITCLIEGLSTRSATLSSIIDDAALLAASQGDLDLLLRMRTWSNSLLDPGLVAFTMTNIVEGVIKYGIGKQAPEALDEAYRIAQDIEDPSLRMQLSERIVETLVRIGCDIISDSAIQNHRSDKRILLSPFRKGLTILKTEVNRNRISLKLAGLIDILLSASKNNSNIDFILPLVLYSIEIEDPLERNAMMARIIANLDEDLISSDSADPYEILVYILQKHYSVRSLPEIIDLISGLLNQTQEPFERLKGLCMLADSTIEIDNHDRTLHILNEVGSGIQALPLASQKIQILADLTIRYSNLDPEMAKTSIEEGLKFLEIVEPDKEAVARRQMVYAIASMNGILPEDKQIQLILNITAKVSDPTEYVKSLVSAYSLIRDDKTLCDISMRQISEAIEKIGSPYDQALLILEVVPLAVKNGDDKMSLVLLKKAEALSNTLNIQHIADTIRNEIAMIFEDLAKKEGKNSYLKKSADVLASIEDDELRQYRLSRLGFDDVLSKNSAYEKIITYSEKYVTEESPLIHVAALEKIVRSVTDRGKRALLFCRLSILFQNKGDMKSAKRMLANASKESGIIRPLSKRSYIRCDMAMKMYAAGYEYIAQEILDDAIDAATNIRQASLRDDVFNELGLAIRLMQGMQE